MNEWKGERKEVQSFVITAMNLRGPKGEEFEQKLQYVVHKKGCAPPWGEITEVYV